MRETFYVVKLNLTKMDLRINVQFSNVLVLIIVPLQRVEKLQVNDDFAEMNLSVTSL